LATSRMAQMAGETAEKVIERIKNWLD